MAFLLFDDVLGRANFRRIPVYKQRKTIGDIAENEFVSRYRFPRWKIEEFVQEFEGSQFSNTTLRSHALPNEAQVNKTNVTGTFSARRFFSSLYSFFFKLNFIFHLIVFVFSFSLLYIFFAGK